MENNLSNQDNKGQGDQNPFYNARLTQGLFGGFWAQNLKQPIKELTEEEKAQYRMSRLLTEPKHGQLLWQETQKNKILTHLSLHSESPLLKLRNNRQGDRKAVRRIYIVQRRKDIKKDDFSATLSYGRGMSLPDVAQSLGVAAKHFRELKVKIEQGSSFQVMANWMKIFYSVDLTNIKTLSLQMESWYILEPNEGQFSVLKSFFPNLENLQVIFRQMHGKKNIPIQDWTLNFIRRLRKLKALSIEFSYCGFFKNEHLGTIIKALRSRLDSLESLELVFDGSRKEIELQINQDLWESFDSIPNLKA